MTEQDNLANRAVAMLGELGIPRTEITTHMMASVVSFEDAVRQSAKIDDSRLRLAALDAALRLHVTSSGQDDKTVATAKMFYAFLTGKAE